MTAVKKTVTQKIEKELNKSVRPEDNEDLKNMADLWEADKKKNKEKIAKINEEMEQIKQQLEGKD